MEKENKNLENSEITPSHDSVGVLDEILNKTESTINENSESSWEDRLKEFILNTPNLINIKLTDKLKEYYNIKGVNTPPIKTALKNMLITKRINQGKVSGILKIDDRIFSIAFVDQERKTIKLTKIEIIGSEKEIVLKELEKNQIDMVQ